MWQQCQGRARRMCGHVRSQRWPTGLRMAQRPSLGHVCWREYVWGTSRLKGKLRAGGCGMLLAFVEAVDAWGVNGFVQNDMDSGCLARASPRSEGAF